MPWGGVNGIGTLGSFYVSVNAPLQGRDTDSSNSTADIDLA